MLVSIIIPFYNSEKFLQNSIDSALSQTYKKTELILIDNNSTDGTLRELESYKAKYPGKIRVYQENKKGAPHARNLGLNQAKGEWLQFLDADDEILPDKINHQLQLATLSKADLIVGYYDYISSGKEKVIPAHPNPWEGLILSKLGITSANLWKTEVVKNCGGWDPKCSSSQEYHLMFEMLKTGASIVHDPAVLTRIYHRENSVSKSLDKERNGKILKNRLNLRIAMRDFLISSGAWSPSLKVVWEKYMYSQLYWNKNELPEIFNQYFNKLTFNLPFLFRYRKIIASKIRKFIKT